MPCQAPSNEKSAARSPGFDIADFRMDGWPINLQVKQGVVHKIRPGVWYSDRPGNIPMFKRMEDFIAAIEETVYKNPKTHETAASWRDNFIKSYKKFYGVELNIPRWQDIKMQYEIK